MACRESPVARETAEIPPHPSAMASAFGHQPPRPFIEFPGHSLESLLDRFFFFHASYSITSSLILQSLFLDNSLAQPTVEMAALRQVLTEQESFPSRRTWERRLKAIPETLPAQIGCLGRHLIDLIEPWATCGRAVAIDSTVLQSRGGVWHQKHREQGEIPHSSIDTEAHWTKSGWHGWVYGWKLHVISVVAAVWFPLAAVLTPANVADSEPAPGLLCEVPAEVRFVLGDRHYNTPDLHALCERDDRALVATRYGRYPHTDAGVEVRRVFHKLRSLAMENFNELIFGIFDGHGQVPTKGLIAT